MRSATNEQDIEATKKPDEKDCKQGRSLKSFDNSVALASLGFTLFSLNGFLIDWVSKCSLSNGNFLRKLPIASVPPSVVLSELVKFY